MLIELTKDQQSALMNIINNAGIKGTDVEFVAALKRAVMTEKKQDDSGNDDDR